MSISLVRRALLASTFSAFAAVGTQQGVTPAFAAERSPGKAITLSLREPNPDSTLAAVQQEVGQRINAAWAQATLDHLKRFQFILLNPDYGPGKGIIAGFRTLEEAQAEQKSYPVSMIVDWTNHREYGPAFQELARREGWITGLPPEPNPDRK